MGLIENIMAAMRDDEGIFQGGRGGRMFGRARDVMGQYMPDTEGLAFRSRDLEDFQKGILKEGTRARSHLLRSALKGKDVYTGGQKRRMTLADLGFEGDPVQDPTRWGELFEFGGDFSKYRDPRLAEEWHSEAIQSALEEGYKGDDFGDVWNKYGMPHIKGARGALFQHGKKTGDITGDILAGGDVFDVGDLVQRSGMVPDIKGAYGKGVERSLAQGGSLLPLTEADKHEGTPTYSRYTDEFRGHKDVGEYSQRQSKRDLRKSGFSLDSRIEDPGYGEGY